MVSSGEFSAETPGKPGVGAGEQLECLHTGEQRPANAKCNPLPVFEKRLIGPRLRLFIYALFLAALGGQQS